MPPALWPTRCFVPRRHPDGGADPALGTLLTTRVVCPRPVRFSARLTSPGPSRCGVTSPRPVSAPLERVIVFCRPGSICQSTKYPDGEARKKIQRCARRECDHERERQGKGRFRAKTPGGPQQHFKIFLENRPVQQRCKHRVAKLFADAGPIGRVKRKERSKPPEASSLACDHRPNHRFGSFHVGPGSVRRHGSKRRQHLCGFAVQPGDDHRLAVHDLADERR